MLDKTYRPAKVEARQYQAWEEGGGFGCAPDSNRRPFTVMVTSAAPLRGLANYSMYATARGAANALVKSLSLELAPFNIQINAIAPNYIENPTYFPPELLANETAMFLADRIALMRDGAVVQVGAPVDLYFRPVSAFAAEFFGEVNRLAGKTSDGSADTPLGIVEAAGLADETEVEILIRPEGLRLTQAGPHSVGVTARVEAARLLGRTSLIHLTVPTHGYASGSAAAALRP